MVKWTIIEKSILWCAYKEYLARNPGKSRVPNSLLLDILTSFDLYKTPTQISNKLKVLRNSTAGWTDTEIETIQKIICVALQMQKLITPEETVQLMKLKHPGFRKSAVEVSFMCDRLHRQHNLAMAIKIDKNAMELDEHDDEDDAKDHKFAYMMAEHDDGTEWYMDEDDSDEDETVDGDGFGNQVLRQPLNECELQHVNRMIELSHQPQTNDDLYTDPHWKTVPLIGRIRRIPYGKKFTKELYFELWKPSDVDYYRLCSVTVVTRDGEKKTLFFFTSLLNAFEAITIGLRKLKYQAGCASWMYNLVDKMGTLDFSSVRNVCLCDTYAAAFKAKMNGIYIVRKLGKNNRLVANFRVSYWGNYCRDQYFLNRIVACSVLPP